MCKYPTKYVLASDDEFVIGFDHFAQLFTFLCLYPRVVLNDPNMCIYRFVDGVKSVHPLMVCVTTKLKPLSFQVRYYKSNNGYVMYVGYSRVCELTRARSATTM